MFVLHPPFQRNDLSPSTFPSTNERKQAVFCCLSVNSRLVRGTGVSLGSPGLASVFSLTYASGLQGSVFLSIASPPHLSAKLCLVSVEGFE